jgi:hypothetical protein
VPGAVPRYSPQLIELRTDFLIAYAYWRFARAGRVKVPLRVQEQRGQGELVPARVVVSERRGERSVAQKPLQYIRRSSRVGQARCERVPQIVEPVMPGQPGKSLGAVPAVAGCTGVPSEWLLRARQRRQDGRERGIGADYPSHGPRAATGALGRREPDRIGADIIPCEREGLAKPRACVREENHERQQARLQIVAQRG